MSTHRSSHSLWICLASSLLVCACDTTTSRPTALNEAFAPMVYDSVRAVIVRFGDEDRPTRNTWENDGSGWVLVSSEGPPPRSGASLAYDSAREVTVMFGGFFETGEAGFSDETWEWNGEEWTEREVEGPAGRSSAAMAFDESRGVTVLFGGQIGSVNDETWEWDGETWEQVSAPGPTARARHAMSYDSLRGVIVLFGGFLGSNNDELWEWNGIFWTPLGFEFGPTPRSLHSMAFDAVRGVTVLFGGHDGEFDEETWEWNGFEWALKSFQGPSARASHALAYDVLAERVILFGGNDGNPNDETWSFDGTLWTQMIAEESTSAARAVPHLEVYEVPAGEDAAPRLRAAVHELLPLEPLPASVGGE